MTPVRVLLVEDELDDALAARRSLPEDQGFRVQHVRRGQDAMDAEEGFDAVVVDQRLPDVSGLKVVRTLRRRGFAGPLILLSSVQQDSMVAGALAAGADDFVWKTADYGDRLKDAVRQHLMR